MNDGRHAQRRDTRAASSRVPEHEQRVAPRAPHRAASRSRPDGRICSVEIGRRHQQQVDRPRQLQMLKPIVEEDAPCSRSGARRAGRRDSDRRRRAPARQEARAPASAARRPSRSTGSSTRSPSLTTTTPSARAAARVAAAENRRPLAHRRAAGVRAPPRPASCRCRRRRDCRR